MSSGDTSWIKDLVSDLQIPENAVTAAEFLEEFQKVSPLKSIDSSRRYLAKLVKDGVLQTKRIGSTVYYWPCDEK